MGSPLGSHRAAGGAVTALVGAALVAAVLAAPAGQAAAVAEAAHTGRALSTTAATPARQARIGGPDGVRSVVAVSLDGLNPDAIRRLGRQGTPTLHRLMRWGASTLNARTSRKRTETLPNHTGMVTGRTIDKRHGGHGIERNALIPGRVQDYAGHDVGSAWSVVGHHGGSGGLFASKEKFVLFKRSWTIDRTVLQEDDSRLVTTVRRDLVRHDRAFRLVHLSAPDVAGHSRGFMSPAYLAAVRQTDRQLRRIVNRVANTHRLRRSTVLIVTADHGGRGRHGHSQAGRLVNYRVPFIVWGHSVGRGANLYRLNPDYQNPGTRRTRWSQARQPVRNTDVANLSLDLLGLPAIHGSRADLAQHLDWR